MSKVAPEKLIDRYLIRLDSYWRLTDEEILSAMKESASISPDAGYLERLEVLKRYLDEACWRKAAQCKVVGRTTLGDAHWHMVLGFSPQSSNISDPQEPGSLMQEAVARDSARRAVLRRFLLREENSRLLRDMLRNVHFTEPNKHSLATVWKLGPTRNPYEFFVLYDFLIQFSFVAMFIGIFIQMIFEERNITES